MFEKYIDFNYTLYYVSSTKFGEHFEEKYISASFKMFRTKKLKSKSPTDSRDFCPNPPSMENSISFNVFFLLKPSLSWNIVTA